MNATGGAKFRESVIDMNTAPIDGHASPLHFSPLGAIASGMYRKGEEALFVLPPGTVAAMTHRVHHGGLTLPAKSVNAQFMLLNNDFAVVEMTNPSFPGARGEDPQSFFVAFDRQTGNTALLGARRGEVYGSATQLGTGTFCWLASLNMTETDVLTCWMPPSSYRINNGDNAGGNGPMAPGMDHSILPSVHYVHHLALQLPMVESPSHLTMMAPPTGTGSVEGDARLCFAMQGRMDDDPMGDEVGTELHCVDLRESMHDHVMAVGGAGGTMPTSPAMDDTVHPQLIWDANPGPASGLLEGSRIQSTGGDTICHTARTSETPQMRMAALAACHRVWNLGYPRMNATSMENMTMSDDGDDGDDYEDMQMYFMVESTVGLGAYLPASDGFGATTYPMQGGPAVLGVGRLAYVASSDVSMAVGRDVFVIDQRANTTTRVHVMSHDPVETSVRGLQGLGSGIVFFNGSAGSGSGSRSGSPHEATLHYWHSPAPASDHMNTTNMTGGMNSTM